MGLLRSTLPLEMVFRLLNNTRGIMQMNVEIEKGTRPDKVCPQ